MAQNRVKMAQNRLKWLKTPGRPQKGGVFYRLSEKMTIFALCNCRIQKCHFFNFPAPPRGFFQKMG